PGSPPRVRPFPPSRRSPSPRLAVAAATRPRPRGPAGELLHSELRQALEARLHAAVAVHPLVFLESCAVPDLEKSSTDADEGDVLRETDGRAAVRRQQDPPRAVEID